MDDRELAMELVELFLNDVPLRLAALSRSIIELHPDEVFRSAHQLKGSCLTLGASEMARICEQLETAGRSQSVEDLTRLGEALVRGFANVRTELGSSSWHGKFDGAPRNPDSGLAE